MECGGLTPLCIAAERPSGEKPHGRRPEEVGNCPCFWYNDQEACCDRRARRMKVREVIRILLDDGWYLVATRGSHRQYKHPRKPRRVTVPGKLSDDLAPGTLNSVLKQAGLKGER